MQLRKSNMVTHLQGFSQRGLRRGRDIAGIVLNRWVMHSDATAGNSFSAPTGSGTT